MKHSIKVTFDMNDMIAFAVESAIAKFGAAPDGFEWIPTYRSYADEVEVRLAQKEEPSKTAQPVCPVVPETSTEKTGMEGAF